MIIDRLKKNQIGFIFSIYIFIPFHPIIAMESKDYLLIDRLVNSCYEDIDSCNSSLLKIHNYQENAALNKNFSCQTRLLGLEANLIMAMNSNFKRKEVKSIVKAVKKYC